MENNNLDFRPKSFDQVIGQDEIKEYLKIKISAFRKSKLAVGHILLLGVSGVGKTTLATVMANEMNVGFHQIMANRIKNWNDFYNIIKNINENDVVFIDEIHALNSKIQEHLYGIMEDFSCTIEDKNLEKTIVCKIPRFTLIGATTHSGELNAPLLSRFQYKGQLIPYSQQELKNIVLNAGKRLYKVDIPDEIASMIARLSRRTARTCYNLLRSYMDVVEAEYPGKIFTDMLTTELLYKTLRLEQIDPIVGLDYVSRRYLVTLLRDNSPLGSRSLSSMINEQENTLLYMIEPFLFSDIELGYKTKEGYIVQKGPFSRITKKGRVATDSAFKYIKLCRNLQDKGWFANESLDTDMKRNENASKAIDF